MIGKDNFIPGSLKTYGRLQKGLRYVYKETSNVF